MGLPKKFQIIQFLILINSTLHQYVIKLNQVLYEIKKTFPESHPFV